MNEFSRKLTEVIDAVKSIEYERNSVTKNLKELITELTPKIQDFNNMEVPTIDGIQVTSITIDETRLTQYEYVNNLVAQLPQIAANIETKGMQKLNQISENLK